MTLDTSGVDKPGAASSSGDGAPAERGASPGDHRAPASRERRLFGLGLATLAVACLVTGAVARPLVDRFLAGRRTPAPGTVAVVLEHAAVDVKLGRGAVVVDPLRLLAPKTADPRTRERVLALLADAAVQAGRPKDALAAEREREGLLKDEADKNTCRTRQVALLAATGQAAAAEKLGRELAAAVKDAGHADQIRMLVAQATRTPEQLKAWVEGIKLDAKPAPEEVRTAALVALTVLRDAAQAERLLGSLQQPGQQDAVVLRALAEAYSQLKRPADVARVAQPLAALAKDPKEAAEIELLRARALLDAGDTAGALQTLDGLAQSAPSAAVRQAARRARYQVMQQQGTLAAEVAEMERKGALPLRAFVALEVEGNYELAEKLYKQLMAAGADDAFERLHAEAAKRKELAERRALYAGVLQKDPRDAAAAEKLLAVLVALRDADGVQRFLTEAEKGSAKNPAALLSLGQMLVRVGLADAAVRVLEQARAAESDAAKKQQITLALADLYAEARRGDVARRAYMELAAGGLSPEVREQALSRLAALAGR